MIITGSALFVEPGSHDRVLNALRTFDNVEYHVSSDCGTELVVNLLADSQQGLEALCDRLKAQIPDIVEIAHFYCNFEEEIERIESGAVSSKCLHIPNFDRQ